MRSARAVREDQPRSRRRAASRRRQARGRRRCCSGSTSDDDIELEPADDVLVEGFADDTLVASCSAASSRAGVGAVVGACASRSGFRWRRASAAGARTPRLRSASRTPSSREPLPRDALHASRRPASARTSRSSCARERCSATGDGTELAPVALPDDYHVVLVLPHGAGEGVDRSRLRRRSTNGAGRAGSTSGGGRCSTRSDGRDESRGSRAPAAERPRLLADRRGARGARSVPRGRVGRRAGRLRPLRARRRRRAARTSARPSRSTWLTSPCGRRPARWQDDLALGRGQVVRQRVLVP